MKRGLARLIANNEQQRTAAQTWWRLACEEEKVALIHAIQASYDEPTLEVMSLFAALAVGEMLERECRQTEEPPRPWVKCQRCGKQLDEHSCGNFEVRDGEWIGVCMACLRPEED